MPAPAARSCERWPDLEVYVHERGARHMVDPARLIKSARVLYGEDMDRLLGRDGAGARRRNLRVLHGGERLLGGAFEVAYTPGHASHHVSYLHDGTAFVGDVGGVRIAPRRSTVPPTPAAGHRRRGVARVDRADARVEAQTGWP